MDAATFVDAPPLETLFRVSMRRPTEGSSKGRVAVRDRGSWEWCVVAADKNEMETLGLSWVFSIDREFSRDVGGAFRLVVWGWGLEVYRPIPRMVFDSANF